MTPVPFRRLLPLLLLLALLPSPAPFARGKGSEQMEFGVQAAKKGLWREALFRWEKALKLSPGNPRILNNLAVARETGGDFQKAEELYREALGLAPNDKDIRQNYELFTAYYKELLVRKKAGEGREGPPVAPAPETQPEERPADAPRR